MINKGDPTVWMFQKTGVIDDLAQHPFATILDVLVFIVAGACFVLLFKRKKAVFPIFFFSALFFLYMMVWQSVPSLSPRKYFGLLLIPFSLVFLGQRFKNYNELIRYFVMFIFFSASLWKLYRGVLTVPDQMVNVLKMQHIESFFLLPNRFIPNEIAKWVILHPSIAQLILFLGVFLQLCFGIGFFTKKFDKLLFSFLVLFLIGDYLLMDIGYWEFLVFTPYFFIPELEKRYGLK